MFIVVNPDFFPMAYNSLNAEIKETITHEFEHIAQNTGKRDVVHRTDDKEFYEYLLLPQEIPAFLKGFLARAKTERKSMTQVIDEFLESRKHLFKNKNKIGIVRTVWTKVGQKQYPQAIWDA